MKTTDPLQNEERPCGLPHLDALLTRAAAADTLTRAGFPIAAKTLATKASRGGGPPYRRFGVRPLYRWGDLLAWAQSRLSPPVCNTSQTDTLFAGADERPHQWSL
jgi:hypothetical protein